MKALVIGILVFSVGCSQTQVQTTSCKTKNSQIDSHNIKVFTWYEELCEYTGKYDPAIVTENQLKNSYELGFFSSRFSIQTKTTAYTQIKEIDELNVDSLISECTRKLSDLKNLEVLPSKYWQDLKEQKILELTKEFELHKLSMLSYKYPDTLRSTENPSECEKYIDALVQGGDTLLKVWSELQIELSEKYGNNESANKRFKENYDSPDRLIYARMDVLNYGWWNCVIQTIPRTKNENFHNEFIKYFIDIHEECDDP